MTIKEIIIENFQTLTPELQKAANFLVEHNNDVAIVSMRTFAEMASVQPSTLLRLAKKLGFAGWGDLKSVCIDEIGLGDGRYASKARTLKDKDTHFYKSIFDSTKENVDRTEKANMQSVNDAVTTLSQGNNVYVCGFRASFSMAYSLYYVYRLFRKDVFLIDGYAGNLEIHTREFDKSDVVVLISFAPYSREIMMLYQAAKDTGCKIIAITDRQVSSFALNADIALYFSTQSPSFFPSLASGAVLIECLLAMLVAHDGDNAVHNIERAEEYFSRSGAYVFNQE
ncbi:MurR/RpiR family transcriptional regulator [Pantoea vagans]|uniref:MurR/RpiR family transcriptional regulator n=1 Tax=Pantoea vagans TaxID=470934 RepID=UPI0023B13EAC|nr:MurR/RpiR family transcriptional regulator [Pantoea vagans]MDE8559381.1 MurR/RpiR family transcriptional regulator [Pantoea vagans]MDE8579376.1 MurR/RpiR family transcriptional regulator [Pantoea vagans]